MSLILLPAVDVSNGQAIRLTQGKLGTEQVHGDPLDAALNWQNAGASWIHLVDLDAAFSKGSNKEIINEVVKTITVNVEVSGGIRDDQSLELALNTGCARVNIGTAALENPLWCAKIIDKFDEKIAIGIDVLNTEGTWRVRGRGWQTDGGDMWEVLKRLDDDGCKRYVVTDVSRDGMLNGVNSELLEEISLKVTGKLIASGGVSSLDDISKLVKTNKESDGKIEGVIIGKALYANKFTIEQALSITKEV